MLLRLLRAEAPPELGAWLDTLEEAGVPSLRAGFISARSRLGEEPWEPSEETGRTLESNRLDWLCAAGAALDDVVRVGILVEATSRADHPVSLVQEWYAEGSVVERRSILRALALLPRPKQHKALALRVARIGEPTVFEAIACENPYPAAYFDDREFEAMIERLLRLDLHTDRVLDAPSRMVKTKAWLAL